MHSIALPYQNSKHKNVLLYLFIRKLQKILPLEQQKFIFDVVNTFVSYVNLNQLIKYKTTIKKIIFSANKLDYNFCFDTLQNLTSINLSINTTLINENMFSNLNKLKKVTLSNNIINYDKCKTNYIDGYTFFDCRNLEEVFFYHLILIY